MFVIPNILRRFNIKPSLFTFFNIPINCGFLIDICAPKMLVDDEELTKLSGKEKLALKRQIKYRTDQSYREKVKEKAQKSKQRDEYKQRQRDYNRIYYQQKKEQM